MTEDNKIDRTVHRYTPLDAVGVVEGLIDGEDPNEDAMAGYMDPVRRLLLTVEDIRVRAHLALTRPMAQGELPMANDIFNCLMDLVGLQHSGHADEEEPVIESPADRVSEMVKEAKLTCALNYGGNDVEEEAFDLLAKFVELHDPEGKLEAATPTDAEVVEFPALTLEGLAAILKADHERLVIFNPATKCLDDIRFVTINGGQVQLTMKDDGDLRVGAGNATEAARELIDDAQSDTDEINTPEAGGEMDLEEMVSHRLEDLHSETLGDASRIGESAWTWYHAVKSEVERLMEGGAK